MKLERRNSVILARDNKVKAGWSQTIGLFSDIHYDSCKCDIDLFDKHMRIAEEKNALVLIYGDFFDAMQTHDDPRRNIEELKAEYKVSNYLDAIVMDAAKFLSKYKVQYIIGLGNHETAILKNCNTNMIDRLAYAINLSGGQAINTGYAGWIKFLFSRGEGNRKSFDLYFHHGSGGGAPVTKGVIQTARQASYINADFVCNGHNHQDYYVPLKQIGLNAMGNLETKLMHFIRTPGYKMSGMEAEDRFGFDIERHPGVMPRGCCFIEFDADYNVDVYKKIE